MPDAKCYILGTGGQTPFGALPEWTVERMMVEPAQQAITNAGIEAKDIQAGFVGNCAGGLFNQQSLSSAFLNTVPGLRNKPFTRVENACASGSGALMEGLTSIIAGLYDVVVVVGWEKMRGDTPKPDMKKVGEVLGTCAHPRDRAEGGLVFPRTFARFMKAYMAEFGATEEQFGHIAVKNTVHANRNPLAQMQSKTLDIATAGTAGPANPYLFPELELPLKARDCSQVTDGAAALVLCSPAYFGKLGKPAKAMKIVGMGQASDSLDLEERQKEWTRPVGLRKAVAAAWKSSGLTAKDIQLAEVHDCFTVAEVLALEALGVAEPGRGAEFSASGATYWNGMFPVNTSGGRIGMGHPVGATGVAMMREIALQTLGEAGDRQVKKADRGLTLNFGGPMSAVYVFVTAAV